MGKLSANTVRPVSEINMTPLMDITFILLITFIITVPLMEQGIAVNLPKGQGDPLRPQGTRTIAIDVAGSLYLDDYPIDAAALAAAMRAAAADDPGVTILVRADEALAYGKVVDVMKILHGAAITRMALVTTEERSADR